MRTLPLTVPQTPFEQSVETSLKLLQTPDAGPTTSRPLIGRLVGQMFFDTVLDQPVWWQGSHWVNAAGAPA